jgi:hypothetical protein
MDDTPTNRGRAPSMPLVLLLLLAVPVLMALLGVLA